LLALPVAWLYILARQQKGFRQREDSKDAVYIFVATAVGLAAAVTPPVALAISLIYNTIILLLWYTDFGRTSAVFEGAVAEHLDVIAERAQSAAVRRPRTPKRPSRSPTSRFCSGRGPATPPKRERRWNRC